jgi:hypothetical protein
MWTLMFSCLSQFVYQFLPGRDLIIIYACSGSFDRALISMPAKINLLQSYFFIISIIWFIFAAARIYHYKLKAAIQINPVHIQIDHHLDHAGAIKDILKNLLVNLVLIACLFLMLLPFYVMSDYLNSIDPELLNSSPGAAALYHFKDHGYVVLFSISFVIIFYGRNATMRKTIFREIKDDFMTFKERFSH